MFGVLLGMLIFSRPDKKETQKTISTHQEIVEKVEAIGKLELVKMTVQDVLEHQIVRQWLPNSKTLIVVAGEVAGAVDLQKLKKEDVLIDKDTIYIRLPKPEIAYCKIDHGRSKVFDTQANFFTGAKLLDDAYKEAEKQLLYTAQRSGIIEQTKNNAFVFFQSFFETLGFSKVKITFEDDKNRN